MYQFYFNECLPNIQLHLPELASKLSASIFEYNCLLKEKLNIEKAIILERSAESTCIANSNLKEIIAAIPPQHRELKRLAYGYLTKYPIQNYLNNNENEDEILSEEYRFGQLDATNLAIAKRNSCFLFTMGIDPTVNKNMLNIKGKTNCFDIDNLYGDKINTSYIESQIKQLNISKQTLFDQLIAQFSQVIYSTSFEKSFKSAQKEVQESILGNFAQATERHLKTPYFPDNVLIKDVTPCNHKKKVKVYELRVYSPVALRVYFYEVDKQVFIARIGYKAAYKKETNAQSRDISAALKEIDRLMKTM